MEVYLDEMGVPLISLPFILQDHVALENGQAWLGFVGSTGASGGNQDILNWSLEVLAAPLAVSIASPLQGGTLTSPGVVDIRANVTSPDSIISAEFYQGSQLLSVTTNAPYSFRWDSIPPGVYKLIVSANDSAGRRITSQPVSLTVYPAEPSIGINFTTASSGTNQNLAIREKAGVIPQYFWNNAPMLPNGNGNMQNLRNAAGQVTPVDVNYDFISSGQEASIDPTDSPDHKLMRGYGASLSGNAQVNTVISFTAIPYAIYDVILYCDSANGLADKVLEIRANGLSTFVRDAAGATFSGIYAAGGGGGDAGINTEA